MDISKCMNSINASQEWLSSAQNATQDATQESSNPKINVSQCSNTANSLSLSPDNFHEVVQLPPSSMSNQSIGDLKDVGCEVLMALVSLEDRQSTLSIIKHSLENNMQKTLELSKERQKISQEQCEKIEQVSTMEKAEDVLAPITDIIGLFAPKVAEGITKVSSSLSSGEVAAEQKEISMLEADGEKLEAELKRLSSLNTSETQALSSLMEQEKQAMEIIKDCIDSANNCMNSIITHNSSNNSLS